MNQPTPVFIRLRTKLAFAFALIGIFSAGLAILAIYLNVRSQLLEDIRERLNDAVAIAALQLDGDAHATLVVPSQEGNETYISIKQTLQEIRDSGTDFRFVYTMRQDPDGNITFIVDAEENPEDISHLGDIFYEAEALLVDNFTSLTGPLVDDKLYTDRWGTWLTGYAPFYRSDGQFEGVIGIDIAADKVVAKEQRVL